MKYMVRFIESKEELETCLSIRRKVFIEEQQVPEELEIDEMDLFVPQRHVLMLAEDVPAGAARFRHLGEGILKYQRIAVLPEHRGKGLGKVLLDGLDQLAVQLGYRHVKIEAQKYAEGFYHHCGFVTVSPEVFMDAGIPHIAMEKDLPVK